MYQSSSQIMSSIPYNIQLSPEKIEEIKKSSAELLYRNVGLNASSPSYSGAKRNLFNDSSLKKKKNIVSLKLPARTTPTLGETPNRSFSQNIKKSPGKFFKKDTLPSELENSPQKKRLPHSFFSPNKKKNKVTEENQSNQVNDARTPDKQTKISQYFSPSNRNISPFTNHGCFGDKISDLLEINPEVSQREIISETICIDDDSDTEIESGIIVIQDEPDGLGTKMEEKNNHFTEVIKTENNLSPVCIETECVTNGKVSERSSDFHFHSISEMYKTSNNTKRKSLSLRKKSKERIGSSDQPVELITSFKNEPIDGNVSSEGNISSDDTIPSAETIAEVFVKGENWDEPLLADMVETVLNDEKQPQMIRKPVSTNGSTLIHFMIFSPSSQFLLNQQYIFNPEDKRIANKYLELDWIEQELYTRLFRRKFGWIRKDQMLEYKFVKDLSSSLNILEYSGFLKCSFEGEDLDGLLNVLQVPELKTVRKKLNMKDKASNKVEMIYSLLRMCKDQKTIFGSMRETIRKHVVAELPSCVKVKDGPRDFFNRLLIAATYPHFRGDEKERLNDFISRFFNMRNKLASYPEYKCEPSLVFQSDRHFEEYRKSLGLSQDLSEEIDKKNWNEARDLILLARDFLQTFLKDKQNTDLMSKLPTYYYKFTSGYKYCGAVSKGIMVLKKEKDGEKALQCLELLLNQRYFLPKRRGQWYVERALIYETRKKDIVEASRTLLKGLLDDIDPISRGTLSRRAEKILAKKNSGLLNEDKDSLRTVLSSTSSVHFEPALTSITAVPLESSGPGFKQTFIRNVEGGKELSSVEETVIDHYKHTSPGYEKGLHDEGNIIRNLALACFWDVIYGEVEDLDGNTVFHNKMQTHPLDWGSEGFYRRRENAIKKKADYIERNGVNSIMEILEKLCAGNSEVCVSGVVNWNTLNFEMLPKIRELLICLRVGVFMKIALHLMTNYSLYSSGFPDLILWDPRTEKCLIVEVKGPNDTLSDHQCYWLKKLHEFGANAEVCKVESLGSNKRKSRTS